jgi:WhiB family transcriptional regulator, redox-sensing transcriptional regulator
MSNHAVIASPRTPPLVGRAAAPGFPCQTHDPDLWFAELPAELERASALCADCPVRARCLSEALLRREPAGVWGGHIFDRGRIVARKRGRGRPRKSPA